MLKLLILVAALGITDADNDGIDDSVDPCLGNVQNTCANPNIDGDAWSNYSANETDIDGDGDPNTTDPDDDGDGVPDTYDVCARGWYACTPKTGSGQGAYGGGPDTDGDGVGDAGDAFPNDVTKWESEVEVSEFDAWSDPVTAFVFYWAATGFMISFSVHFFSQIVSADRWFQRVVDDTD